MTELTLDLPPGAQVSSHLYDSMAVGYLLNDLVCVVLPDGSVIDAGWYPEHVSHGEYVIRLYESEDRESVLVRGTAGTPRGVKAVVEEMARQRCG